MIHQRRGKGKPVSRRECVFFTILQKCTLTKPNLQYWYKPERPVLRDVSFSVASGEIVCLLGPNGTGKTTLLRCLLGLYAPKSGSVVLDGQSLSALANRERAKRMAYVPQTSALAFPYEVREVVLMGRVAHLAPGVSHRDSDREAVAALERLELTHLAHRRFQELSGGERQMVLVARALAQQARYLVMDEPTASLDYGNQVKILHTIRHLAQAGKALIDRFAEPAEPVQGRVNIVGMTPLDFGANGNSEDFAALLEGARLEKWARICLWALRLRSCASARRQK